METENKHPDSANDSVDSFEDAIDNLDLSEDNKNLSKLENNIKPTYLANGETSFNNNVAPSPIIKCDSKKTMTESSNIDKLEITKTNVEDVKPASKSIDTEQMSTETPILSPENDVKTITDNVAILTNVLADVNINKTKFDSVSSGPSDTKTIQDNIISENIENKSKGEMSQKNTDTIVTKSVINETISQKDEIAIKEKDIVSKEPVIEGISFAKTSVEPIHNVTDNENIHPNSKVDSNNENAESAIKVETNHESIELDSNNKKIQSESIFDTNNENKQPESNVEKIDDSKDNTDAEDEEGSIKSEREQGDGQGEQEEDKKELELDEDKRNPEYIPKKGSFYEHDTRTMDGFDDDVKKIEEEIATKNKKKSKSIASESKWQHDKYNELEQCPKSQQEIIDTYGYDIRNEEHPPKARRNRRYGRGPNKYNRNWEDEKAYIKIEYKGPRNSEGRNNRSINDRPRQNKSPTREENYSDFRENRNSISANTDVLTSRDKSPAPLYYPDKIGMKAEKGAWVPPPPFSQKNVVNKSNLAEENESNKPLSRHDRSNQDQDHRPSENQAPAEPLSSFPPLKDQTAIVADKSGPPKQKAFSTLPLNNVAAFVPSPAYKPNHSAKGPSVNIPSNWYLSQNKIERSGPPDSPELPHKDYSKLPGGIAALRGGKRYSVQRQQSIESRSASTTAEIEAMTVEEPGPPGQTLPPPAYYHHPAAGPAPPISLPQSSPSHLVFRQSPPPPVKVISADASGYHSHLYTADTPHPISNGSGGAPPMLLPVHFVSPPPSQVPSFNNAQAPIMSYGPQPLQFQPIVNLPPPPQTEVFQPAGGITYYSPQTQAVLQRPALSKRVKAAIPIVPPSEVNIQQTNLAQQTPNNIVQPSNPAQQSDVVINNMIQQKVQLVPVEMKKEDSLNN